MPVYLPNAIVFEIDKEKNAESKLKTSISKYLTTDVLELYFSNKKRYLIIILILRTISDAILLITSLLITENSTNIPRGVF